METLYPSIKTQGQAEALACEIVNHFLQQKIGRGARDAIAMLTPRSLVVHLHDVLTTAERSLTRMEGPSQVAAHSLVRELRDRLVCQARGELAATVAAALGREPQSVLHDIDPMTGEEVMMFTFATSGTGLGRRQGKGPVPARASRGLGST